jgi:hypothetical protein
MNDFHSLSSHFQTILPAYLSNPLAHAKWLNTLSYLENCGARKIARSEHPQNVSKQMLKHAAEEFRHAFYLKQQISTKLGFFLPSYQLNAIWGGIDTLRYLDRLEARICRLINPYPSYPQQAVYFLVTYAIELRASEVYPLYQDLLTQWKSPVSVRSILLEEKGHLEEMQDQIVSLGIGEELIASACEIEGSLCLKWINYLKVDRNSER